jgi:hypothetical protein
MDYWDAWAYLGQYVLDKGASQCVILTNRTDEPGQKTTVGFDAVRWVFVKEE